MLKIANGHCFNSDTQEEFGEELKLALGRPKKNSFNNERFLGSV